MQGITGSRKHISHTGELVCGTQDFMSKTIARVSHKRNYPDMRCIFTGLPESKGRTIVAAHLLNSSVVEHNEWEAFNAFIDLPDNELIVCVQAFMEAGLEYGFCNIHRVQIADEFKLVIETRVPPQNDEGYFYHRIENDELGVKHMEEVACKGVTFSELTTILTQFEGKPIACPWNPPDSLLKHFRLKFDAFQLLPSPPEGAVEIDGAPLPVPRPPLSREGDRGGRAQGGKCSGGGSRGGGDSGGGNSGSSRGGDETRTVKLHKPTKSSLILQVDEDEPPSNSEFEDKEEVSAEPILPSLLFSLLPEHNKMRDAKPSGLELVTKFYDNKVGSWSLIKTQRNYYTVLAVSDVKMTEHLKTVIIKMAGTDFVAPLLNTITSPEASLLVYPEVLMESSFFYATHSAIQKSLWQLLTAIESCHSKGVLNTQINSSTYSMAGDVSSGMLAGFTPYDGKSDPTMIPFAPPEALEDPANVSEAFDVWSAGVLFAEWVTKCAWWFLRRPTGIAWWEQPSELLKELWASPSKHAILQHLETCPSLPPEALNLATQMLRLNPRARCTALQALQHPYFNDFATQVAVGFS